MNTVYPDYYPEFKCIAHKCRHNCCIGWEIDIDPESLRRYQNTKGKIGEKLSQSISFEGDTHFILTGDERCPFLTRENLCELYIRLGEDSLCHICREHPRFYNQTPFALEVGLGLCCEEAAKLIIARREPVHLLGESHSKSSELLRLRARAFACVQNRALTVAQRLSELGNIFAFEYKEFDSRRWWDVLSGLERMDESRSDITDLLSVRLTPKDKVSFDLHMQNRLHEYEQLLHYLLYRYVVKAQSPEEASVYARFACFGYGLVYTLGAAFFKSHSSFTLDDELELVRLFSSEIEYSDENLDDILNELEIFGL